MVSQRPASILAADFGSIHTRVVLFDLVDGVYRLVARGDGRTTVGYPANDVSVGLQRILKQISETTGRKFYSDENRIISPEQPDRSGVDYFVTTASAGRPVRAVMVGLMPHVSIDSALRATSGAYVEPVATLSLEDGMDEEARMNAILLNHPDLIFIAGGTEGGAQSALLELVKVTALSVKLINPHKRPVVLYAGNSDLTATIQEMFGDLTTLLIAENVRPTMDDEVIQPAQAQLGQAYDKHKETLSDSYTSLSEMSSSGVLPTARSYALIADYFTHRQKTNVIAVDVGSAVSVLTGNVNGRSTTHIRTDIGLGHSAGTLVDNLSIESIRQWLPFNMPRAEIINYALNKTLRPATIPLDLRDLYLELALLKVGIQHLAEQARPAWQDMDDNKGLPPIGMIIGAGAALTGSGHPGFDLLNLLDALQPTGITTFKADPYGLIPALGAMAFINPNAVVQILEGNNLIHMGAVVNVSGNPKLDSRALKLKITTEDGEVFEHDVLGGHIWALPLPAGHHLRVEIRAGRGLHIGGKRKLKLDLEGGDAGLIFDARGRPLSLPENVLGRSQLMPQWIHEITGDPLQEIPERWLEAIEEVEVVAEEIATEPAQSRWGFFRRRGKVDDDGDLDARIATMTQEISAVDIADEDEDLDALFADDEEEKDALEDDLGALRDLL